MIARSLGVPSRYSRIDICFSISRFFLATVCLLFVVAHLGWCQFVAETGFTCLLFMCFYNHDAYRLSSPRQRVRADCFRAARVCYRLFAACSLRDRQIAVFLRALCFCEGGEN